MGGGSPVQVKPVWKLYLWFRYVDGLDATKERVKTCPRAVQKLVDELAVAAVQSNAKGCTVGAPGEPAWWLHTVHEVQPLTTSGICGCSTFCLKATQLSSLI